LSVRTTIGLLIITLGAVYYFNPEVYQIAFDWIRDLFTGRGGGPTGGSSGPVNLPTTNESSIVTASNIKTKGISTNKISFYGRDTADEINRQLRTERVGVEKALEMVRGIEKAGELGNQIASSSLKDKH